MRPIAPIHFFTPLIAPSSSSLLHPRPSFLLIPPSSSSPLPPDPSFFLIQHCPDHLKSVKVHSSSILTKALPTNRRTNQPTNHPTNRRTRPHIEMRTHLKTHHLWFCPGLSVYRLYGLPFFTSISQRDCFGIIGEDVGLGQIFH